MLLTGAALHLRMCSYSQGWKWDHCADKTYGVFIPSDPPCSLRFLVMLLWMCPRRWNCVTVSCRRVIATVEVFFFLFFLHKYALRCLSSDAHYTLRSWCGQGPFPDSATRIRFTIAPTWFWTFLFFFSKKNGSSVYVCVCEAVSSCRRAAPLLSESESRSCHAKAQPVSVNINVTGWVTSSSSDCSTLTSETPCGSAVYV